VNTEPMRPVSHF